MAVPRWLRALFAAGEPSVARPATGPPERVAAVQAVLDELAPMLALDGGAVELVGVEADRVTLRFQGACTSCPSRSETLRAALEPRLRERCAWVAAVDAV